MRRVLDTIFIRRPLSMLNLNQLTILLAGIRRGSVRAVLAFRRWEWLLLSAAGSGIVLGVFSFAVAPAFDRFFCVDVDERSVYYLIQYDLRKL